MALLAFLLGFWLGGAVVTGATIHLAARKGLAPKLPRPWLVVVAVALWPWTVRGALRGSR